MFRRSPLKAWTTNVALLWHGSDFFVLLVDCFMVTSELRSTLKFGILSSVCAARTLLVTS